MDEELGRNQRWRVISSRGHCLEYYFIMGPCLFSCGPSQTQLLGKKVHSLGLTVSVYNWDGSREDSLSDGFGDVEAVVLMKRRRRGREEKSIFVWETQSGNGRRDSIQRGIHYDYGVQPQFGMQ